MKVILVKKVKGIGEAHAVKEVADGYARNYLLPNHLAVQASKKSLTDLVSSKKSESKKAEKELEGLQELVDRVDGTEIELEEKVNESGSLYASVSPQKVSTALKVLGFDIKKNQIEMNPIKEAGEFDAKLKFAHGLEADIKIIVSSK